MKTQMKFSNALRCAKFFAFSPGGRACCVKLKTLSWNKKLLSMEVLDKALHIIESEKLVDTVITHSYRLVYNETAASIQFSKKSPLHCGKVINGIFLLRLPTL